MSNTLEMLIAMVDLGDDTECRMLADALEELGRDAEAAALRGDGVVVAHRGRILYDLQDMLAAAGQLPTCIGRESLGDYSLELDGGVYWYSLYVNHSTISLGGTTVDVYRWGVTSDPDTDAARSSDRGEWSLDIGEARRQADETVDWSLT